MSAQSEAVWGKPEGTSRRAPASFNFVTERAKRASPNQPWSRQLSCVRCRPPNALPRPAPAGCKYLKLFLQNNVYLLRGAYKLRPVFCSTDFLCILILINLVSVVSNCYDFYKELRGVSRQGSALCRATPRLGEASPGRGLTTLLGQRPQGARPEKSSKVKGEGVAGLSPKTFPGVRLRRGRREALGL